MKCIDCDLLQYMIIMNYLLNYLLHYIYSYYYEVKKLEVYVMLYYIMVYYIVCDCYATVIFDNVLWYVTTSLKPYRVPERNPCMLNLHEICGVVSKLKIRPHYSLVYYTNKTLGKPIESGNSNLGWGVDINTLYVSISCMSIFVCMPQLCNKRYVMLCYVTNVG